MVYKQLRFLKLSGVSGHRESQVFGTEERKGPGATEPGAAHALLVAEVVFLFLAFFLVLFPLFLPCLSCLGVFYFLNLSFVWRKCFWSQPGDEKTACCLCILCWPGPLRHLSHCHLVFLSCRPQTLSSAQLLVASYLVLSYFFSLFSALSSLT